MTFTDLLIIYLAFGAPLAVYKYLQNRMAQTGTRIVVSTLTFFFWLPVAIEIVYLYLNNAYFSDGFVSRRELDSEDAKLKAISEATIGELIRLIRPSNLHDIRETVDRYAGLSDALREGASAGSGLGLVELFEAAGRENERSAGICLMRRNLRRLDRHHIQARQDFVGLFQQMPDGRFAKPAIDSGIQLARQVDDQIAVEQLTSLAMTMGNLWNAEQQHQAQSITPPSPLTMTATLNSD